MSQDKSLKEGLAFEGDEYEGAVTAFQSMGAQIGLKDLSNIDSPANTAALNFMYDAIHTYKIAPSAVTGWEESNVQAAWLSGQTPFALNWPYIFQLSESKTGAKAAYPAVAGQDRLGAVPQRHPAVLARRRRPGHQRQEHAQGRGLGVHPVPGQRQRPGHPGHQRRRPAVAEERL